MPEPTTYAPPTPLSDILAAFDRYPGHHVIVTHRLGVTTAAGARQTRGRLAVDDGGAWLRLGDPVHLDGHAEYWMSMFPPVALLTNVISITHAPDCTSGHPCHTDPTCCWVCTDAFDQAEGGR